MRGKTPQSDTSFSWSLKNMMNGNKYSSYLNPKYNGAC